MEAPYRHWWRNCAPEVDAEILAIDRLEDELSPLPDDVCRVRELIASLEMCHHKAERWVHIIIEAIGSGQTAKGLGTRSPGAHHPVEQTWGNACAALTAWCAGCPPAAVDLSVGAVPAAQLLGRLGQRSPLKEWQVQRAVERIRSFLDWPRSRSDDSARYVGILEAGSDYESRLRTECPDYYREHDDFWLATVSTTIHHTLDGEEAELSLAVAIDMLMPCNWNFARNLQIVAGAIGGDLKPGHPFAACDGNIGLAPIRSRMQAVSGTLRAFCGGSAYGQETDREVLSLLGGPTPVKEWLAASLDKTIRLQMRLQGHGRREV
jgi:hypothetical protein